MGGGKMKQRKADPIGRKAQNVYHGADSHVRMGTWDSNTKTRKRLERNRLPAILLAVMLCYAYRTIINTTMNATFTVRSRSSTFSCPTYSLAPRSSADQQEIFEPQWNQTLNFVKKEKLTFIEQKALYLHRDRIEEIERTGIPGMIVECGVAKAGSSILMAAMKHPNRCLHLFDTFEGMPEPTDRDGKDVHDRYKEIQENKEKCLRKEKGCSPNYYGNMDDLLGFVQQKFNQSGFPPDRHHISFSKGLFQDTVWPAGPIAYAHLDGDWYESTFQMLRRLAPWISVGGYFVLDDVTHFSGARKAFTDFFDIDVDWLKKRECWTTSIDSAVDGNKVYHLMFRHRAMAQVVSDEKSSRPKLEIGDLPKCRPAPK